MTVPRSPDASLYELAARLNAQSQPLQISPTTFKSLIEVVVDLLLEHQLPATVWLKLPRGEVWQTEFNRLCQSLHPASTIYALQTYGRSSEPSPAEADEIPQDESLTRAGVQEHSPEAAQLVTDERTQAHPTSAAQTTAKLYMLPLAADSQLKREYFLMVASPELYGLVLAHRPRSVRSRTDAGMPDARAIPGFDESLEQKHPLLGLCSFESSVLQAVLHGVNQAICFGQPETASNAELAELLIAWEDLVAQDRVGILNPRLVEQIMTKQAQRQEEIWRSSAIYRRQAEQVNALNQTNEELLNALRTKDDFVKTMGQELRTPLTNMKTALSLLNSPQLKTQQRQRYMDMLSRECDRQSSLISSVLDLVQIESAVEQTPMEALRLADIVPGVVSTYQPLAQEKGLMLGYMIPEDLPPVSCTNQWLKQIVIHLLHNSIKFTPTGGQVWVRARSQGNRIQMEFRDTGMGIPQAEIPKIFDRFYRVRGSGEDISGAGLGLSIVQQLLLRCGGSISVKSKPGEGSIFSVLLPIYIQPDAARSEERLGGQVRE